MKFKKIISTLLLATFALTSFSVPARATVTSTTNRVDYTGSGSAHAFPYTFRIFANTDLLVTVRDSDSVETTLVLNTDYSVTGVGNNSGSITLIDASQDWLDADGDLAATWSLTIRRIRPLTQLTDIRNQGTYFPETHEDQFDRQIMIAQQQQNEIDRSIKFSETSTTTGITMPEPEPDKCIGWNSDADGLENLTCAGGSGSSDLETTPVVFGDGTADCFRFTLNTTVPVASDEPYIEFCRDSVNFGNTQTDKAYTLFRPGAGDLIVADDIVSWDTTPNFRWWDLSSGSEDFEAQVEDGKIVFKAVGDTSPTPHTYNTREYMVYYAIANADGGSNADETLQLGGSATYVSIGGTANPSTFFQVTQNQAVGNSLVDFITYNLRYSGGAGTSAGYGMTIQYLMEDGVGSTGESAHTMDVKWNDPTNGSEDAEVIWNVKDDGTMQEAFRVDESRNFSIGVTNPTAKFHVRKEGALTTSDEDVAIFDAATTGTAAAGFGATVAVNLEDAAGTSQGAFELLVDWNVATDAAETAETKFRQVIAGAMTELARFDENGRLGVGVSNPTTLGHFVLNDSTTNSSTNVFTVTHNSTGTAAAGLGAGILFSVEDDGGNTAISAGSIEASWQSAVAGATYSEMIFKTRVNNSFAERCRIDENGRFSCGNTNPTGVINGDLATATGVTAEAAPIFYSDSTTQTLTDGTTITNWRSNRFQAPTLNGAAGGGTETITNGSTVYIADAPSGTDITFTNGPYALFIDSGQARFDGRIVRQATVDIASAGDMTLGSDGNLFRVTGTTTINGIASAGWGTFSEITLYFTASVTVKHNTAASAGFKSFLLAGAADFSATADDTLNLFYDGTVWREKSRAVI